LNCAALPYELLESELFGYEKGAFTGAFKNSPSKFEMANHGTILLDEIGDMDFQLQAKLLEVLQDREFLKLGARKITHGRRVIAATHCDLEKAIRESRFGEDLYYRLNIIEIHVPPLRERKDEAIESATTFNSKVFTERSGRDHAAAEANSAGLRLAGQRS
jgi:two-component system response regulator AtoC